MKNLQKLGGLAALIEALTFIFGFTLFFTLIASANYASLELDPLQNAAFLAENQGIMYLWNFVIYIVFGIVLVFLTLALHERFKVAAPGLSQAAAVFGFIWSGLVIASGMVANIGATVITQIYEKDPVQAGSSWLSLHFVTDGLGGGNEIVGGIWVLLLSMAALKTHTLPRLLSTFGLVVSLAGIFSMIPALGEVGGAIFGLGLIVWFIYLGIVMLVSDPLKAVEKAARFEGNRTTRAI